MRSAIDDAEVLVVGGGPAGFATALRLVQLGHEVKLLERQAAPPEKICGEYLCPLAVQALARLDLFAQLPAGQLRPIRRMLLVSPAGIEVPTRFPVTNGPGPAASVARRHLESALERLAVRHGVTVLRGHTVTRLEPRHGGVEVQARDEHGARTLRARAAVGADGRHSLVARRSGLARKSRTRERGVVHAWYEGVDVGDQAQMHFLPGGAYLGLDPLADGRWNAGLVTDADVVKQVARTRTGVAFLARHLAASPSLARRFAGARVVGVERYLMPLSVASVSPVADRVLLVGDAAGFLDPLTGEGIHSAVETGRRAAEVLHEGLRRDRLDARALGSYARWRRRFLRRKKLRQVALQWLLRAPWLLDHVARRLAGRPAQRDALIGVVGDLLPPTRLGRPDFWAPLLWPALRPRRAT